MSINHITMALGLFSSVIKSGEQWSPTCEAALANALKELDELLGWTPISEAPYALRVHFRDWLRNKDPRLDLHLTWFEGVDYLVTTDGTDAVMYCKVRLPLKDLK